MAKRRTRKDKKEAKHNIKISWEPQESASKKTYKKKRKSKQKHNKTSSKNKYSYSGDKKLVYSIKKDIIKSLGLAGFIISIELVIYFIL